MVRSADGWVEGACAADRELRKRRMAGMIGRWRQSMAGLMVRGAGGFVKMGRMRRMRLERA
jgi:hypothetical protein